MHETDTDDGWTETTDEDRIDRPKSRLAEIAPRPPAKALAESMPECEACGNQTPDGRGGEFGDETYGWLCEECHGDLALSRYSGVDGGPV